MGMGRRSAKPKMSPKELRAIIEALDVSQGKFAEMIGVTRPTVVGYLNERSIIPGPVAILSRILKTQAGK